MSQQQVTAAQIAAALQVPKRTVLRRAEREGWPCVEQTARGGARREYAAETLPADVRAALAWRQPAVVVGGAAAALQAQAQAEQLARVANAGRADGARLALRGALDARADQARRQTQLRKASELRPEAAARMDGKLAVLRALDQFTKASRLPRHQARTAFALAYNAGGQIGAGGIDIPAAAREQVASVSDSTLERWQQLVRQQGIAALGGAYGNRAGSGRLDAQPALAEFVRAMLVQYPHARATQVMRALRARFESPSAPVRSTLPSLRALEQWMARWRADNAELVMALADPDAWKNRYMAAFGSKSEGITSMNQLWERDSSPADVMCTDGRYSLIGGIDVYTRCAMLLVARTSKAVAVGAHLRTMLLAYGVPQADKTDNGSDYTALYTERVYDALDIRHELCPPFQPWHKPHIERFFGTFTRSLVELLPDFVGHNVAERSAIEARKSFAERLMKRGEVVPVQMTGEQLQDFCTRWVRDVYHHDPHEGLDGRTPFEVAAGCAGTVRRIPDERALDILLAEAPGGDGRRTVQKKGVKLDSGWYIAAELEAWIGREVRVCYDPIHHDLGTVHVFAVDDGRWLCRAMCPERTGVDRREVAMAAKRLQRERVQAQRRAARADARRVDVMEVVDEVLRSKAQAQGKLATLPARETRVHQSAGLAAAADAAAAALAPRRTTADLVELELAQARIRAKETADAEGITEGTPNELAEQRLRRAGGLLQTPDFERREERVMWLFRQARVRELSGEEREYLGLYRREHQASFRRLESLAHELLAGAADADPTKKTAPGRVADGTGAD